MYDDEQAGWLAGDDYERAAAMRAARTTDEPDREPGLLGRLLSGRWEDPDPIGVGQ